jgi:hypothetical protein
MTVEEALSMGGLFQSALAFFGLGKAKKAETGGDGPAREAIPGVVLLVPGMN